MSNSLAYSGLVVVRCMAAWVLLCAFGLVQAQSLSKMALLLPDGLALTQPQVTAWTDAAKEQGFSLAVLRNAALLQQGAGIRSQYSGIIVPDQMQVSMSDALIHALENYVSQGGHLMLVYDAGALTAAGFYAIPKSRFSALVGVDYVLYDALRERTIGLGPVIGAVSTLRAIQIPPGKSMLYTPTESVQSVISPLAAAAAQSGKANALPLADFLPSSASNVGGMTGHDHARYFVPPLNTLNPTLPDVNLSPRERIGTLLAQIREHKQLRREGKALKHERATQQNSVAQATPSNFAAQLVAAEPVHSISGYIYGALTYPSYVTQGAASGEVLLSSPLHGLVASRRTVGSGSVLFVNLPLTYLKLSEDAMPLHGFLHWFASGPLKQPRLTSVPNGIGGLVFNWHLDSNAALEPMQQLKNMGVWNHKPFSIHMTAGPDTIVPGDKLGFDLPNNAKAKKFLRDFDDQGHEVGSHGGWIHDYYGNNASETNEADYVNYLVLNRNAIQAVLGHPMAEYSAPQGNNPLWSLAWLARNNFGSYYSLSHTGSAATRTYRQGKLEAPALWAFPVTPLGVAATFEEFDELAFTEQELSQWYKELIDFSINNQSNRLIYAHPPGALRYPNVINSLLQYARQKQNAGQFSWYTMANLSAFMNTRTSTTWSSGLHTNGKMRVTASHPASLNTLTWAYAKNAYARPVAVSGSIQVVDQGTDWLVRVRGGRSVVFEAAPI